MIFQKDSKAIIGPLVILVVSALAIRLFAFTHTMMMNPDGPLYIHQARALYYGLWQAINTCSGVDYPTLYTVLIAAAYPVTGDWVHAAMAVNLIFGTLMIIPLYLFLRRFLDEKTSFLTTFIFVMLPLFVVQSANVIRDPSYWFFSVLGFYLLVYDDERDTPVVLVLSSLSFILATATRIEGIVFIIGGCLYTLMVFKGRRLKALLLFLSPMILAISCLIVVQLIRHPDSFYWYRFQEIPGRIIGAFEQYQDLRTNLKPLVLHPPPGIPPEFMDYSRTLIWFTALGVVLNSAMEAFFYPFFLLLLYGMSGLRARMQNDRRILPLVITVAISFIVLYLYCLNIWSMENRRLAMVIFPSTLLVGFGAEKLIRWLHKRFGLADFIGVVVLCILVLVLTLPKNLKVREADKLVFKEIGETIVRLDGSSGEIEMITLGSNWRFNDYYANLHVQGAPCPEKYTNWGEFIGGSYDDFIRSMRMQNIRYIVWEEKRWPRDKFAFLNSVQQTDLTQLKEWAHRDTGRIILYRVLYQKKG
jgi:4-amino-4-deoxy-L-arabinose transferase-like glycosyltransferase